MKLFHASTGRKLSGTKSFVLSFILLALLPCMVQAKPVAHIMPPSTSYAAKWDPMVAATAMRFLSINLASRHGKWIKYWPAWQEKQIAETDYPRISVTGSGEANLVGRHTIHVHLKKSKNAKPQEIASVNVGWASYAELRQSILNLHDATLKALAEKLSLDLSNPTPPQQLPADIARSVNKVARSCFPGERFTCYRALKEISKQLNSYPASPDLFALAAMGTAIQMRYRTFDYIHVGRTQAIPASYMLMAELLAGKAADKYKLAQAWTAWSSGYPTFAKKLHATLSKEEQSDPEARAIYMLSTTDYRGYYSGSVLENIAWAIALRRSNYPEHGEISEKLNERKGRCEYSEYAPHVAYGDEYSDNDKKQLKLVTPKLIAHYNHILARISRDILLDSDIPQTDRRVVANEILREMKLKPAPSGEIYDDAKQIAKTAMASTKFIDNAAAHSIALCLATAGDYPAGPIVADGPIRWQVLSPVDFAEITRKEVSRTVRRLTENAHRPSAKKLVAEQFLLTFVHDRKLAYMFELLKLSSAKDTLGQNVGHGILPPKERHLKWAIVDLMLEKTPPTFDVKKLPAPRGAYELIGYNYIARNTNNKQMALQTQAQALAVHQHCLLNIYCRRFDQFSFDMDLYKDVFKYVALNSWAKPAYLWLAKVAMSHAENAEFREGFMRTLEQTPSRNWYDPHKIINVWSVLSRVGQYERMEKYIAKVTENKPQQDSSIYTYLMRAMYMQGKYKAMLKVYPANCTSAGPSVMKGLALEKLGRLDEAEKAFRLAARATDSCKGKYVKSLVGFMIRHKYPPAKIYKAVETYGIMTQTCDSCMTDMLDKFRIWPGYSETLVELCLKYTKRITWKTRDRYLYRTINTDRLASLTEACKLLPEYSRQFFNAKNWKVTRGIINTKSSLISWKDYIPLKSVMLSSRPDMFFRPVLPDEFVMYFLMAKDGRLEISLAEDDKLSLGNYDKNWVGYTSAGWGQELKSHASAKHYRDDCETFPVTVIWQKKSVEIWMSGMLVFRGSKSPEVKPAFRIYGPDPSKWGEDPTIQIAEFKVYAITKQALAVLNLIRQ